MKPTDIRIIGAPVGIGGGHTGTAHGPTAARAAGIVERLQRAHPDATTHDAGDAFGHVPLAENRLKDVAACCAQLRAQTKATVLDGMMPIVIGGDHSLAVGSMAGVAAARRAQGEVPPGLLWIDAHTDINTHETTPSGNPHGMSAAALIGLDTLHLSDVVGRDGLFDPSRMVYIGTRDVDPGEQVHIDQHDITVFTSQEVKDRGVNAVMSDALAIVAPQCEPFALTFDIDVLDPDIAPGVDTAVPNGLALDDVRTCLTRAATHAPILAIDMVELNPEKDIDNRTALIAVECIEALVQACSTIQRT